MYIMLRHYHYYYYTSISHIHKDFLAFSLLGWASSFLGGVGHYLSGELNERRSVHAGLPSTPSWDSLLRAKVHINLFTCSIERSRDQCSHTWWRNVKEEQCLNVTNWYFNHANERRKGNTSNHRACHNSLSRPRRRKATNVNLKS